MAKKRGSKPLTDASPRPQTGASLLPEGYDELIRQLKERIGAAQIRAALAVNRELVLLYWRIGRDILDRQGVAGWGAKIIDRLSADLRLSFPGVEGFSARNLKYMRAFAQAWPDEEFVQQVAAQIPWFHNCVLMDKVKAVAKREWYLRKTIENGWSRNMLVRWIESDLHARQGKAKTNFERTLPAPRSDLARELLKDPYNFDFLSLADDAAEAEIEKGLMDHIPRFLLELGEGFAFVGRQKRLEVGGEDFYIDLLFYHLRLRCFIVIDLKATPFRPEHAGKMNFYLSAIDDLLRHADDNPSIGIILCKEKNNVVAEYALRDLRKPVGVASVITKLVESLPRAFPEGLPTAKELDAERNGKKIERK